MALTYGFYNSLKGDRRYNAEQVSEIFDGILKDGIIPSIGQLFVVKTANNRMQITVGTGRAWFDHTWTKNDSTMVLTVPPSDVTRARYDAVVLEVNHTDRINSIKIVQGSPAVNPLKPTLVNTDKIRQYPLAYILVQAGSSEIKASNIDITVGRSPTPFATGILEVVPIDDLWNQWNGEFTEWFDNIKAQLSGNIATNLQNQIDAVRSSIPEKATTNEVLIGSNDTKFVTPSTLKSAIDVNRIYLKDNNGTLYTWMARNYLPMLNITERDGLTEEILTDGTVIYLANYAVLHYGTDLWVFDKAGSTRNYSVSCDLGPKFTGIFSSNYVKYKSLSTERAVAIKGTNSYIAFSDNSLYRISITSSTPKVEVYYTWPSEDGTPKALSYINAEWSALVLEMSQRRIRIYKIPNGYISQPTIYTVSLGGSGTPPTDDKRRLYGIADHYAIYVELHSTASSNIDDKYAAVDLLNGSIVRSFSNADFGFSSYAYTFVRYFSDEVNHMFCLIANNSTIVSFVSGSGGVNYSINSIKMEPYGIYLAGNFMLLDKENGSVCFLASLTVDETTEFYILRVLYTSGYKKSIFTIPPGINALNASYDISSLNGSSNYITIVKKVGEIYNAYSRSMQSKAYAITNPTMTQAFTYLEMYPMYVPVGFYPNGSDGLYSSITLPIPRAMIYDRFIYARTDSLYATRIETARYDMRARAYIGIPV